MNEKPQKTPYMSEHTAFEEIYAYADNYVRRRFNSLSRTDQEVLIQGAAMDVWKNLDSFDSSKGTFKKFLNFHCKAGASQAYHEQQGRMCASAYVLKRAKAAQEELQKGLSVDEVAAKMGIKKNTVLRYMNATAPISSLDAVNDDGMDLHERIPAAHTRHPAPKIDFSGFSEQEMFIAQIYLENADRKDWKKQTLAESAKWGLSKKVTMDVIKKVKRR